eukprot:15438287-Alexandrium_andersonii.AAC.1
MRIEHVEPLPCVPVPQELRGNEHPGSPQSPLAPCAPRAPRVCRHPAPGLPVSSACILASV